MKGPWLNLLLSKAALGGGATPANAAPVNTSAPTLSGGTGLGDTVTIDPGVWSGYPYPTYAYVHKRDGAAISGANSAAYTLVLADQGTTHTGTVTATNTSGAPASATTAGLAIPASTGGTGYPAFTSSAVQTVAENSAFSLSLTTDIPSTFTVVGGADASLFNMAGSTVGASPFNYEAPLDIGANNVYDITVRATSNADPTKYTDQNMTITVTNVAETVLLADGSSRLLLANGTSRLLLLAA